MCRFDEGLLVHDVHVNVNRPACRERESVSAAGKTLCIMIKGDEGKQAACSVLLHVFFFSPLAFAFSLIFPLILFSCSSQ